MIILHELRIDARFGKGTTIPALEKEPAVVAEHTGLDDLHVGNGRRRDFHCSDRSVIAPAARATGPANTGRIDSSPCCGRGVRPARHRYNAIDTRSLRGTRS